MKVLIQSLGNYHHSKTATSESSSKPILIRQNSVSFGALPLKQNNLVSVLKNILHISKPKVAKDALKWGFTPSCSAEELAQNTEKIKKVISVVVGEIAAKISQKSNEIKNQTMWVNTLLDSRNRFASMVEANKQLLKKFNKLTPAEAEKLNNNLADNVKAKAEFELKAKDAKARLAELKAQLRQLESENASVRDGFTITKPFYDRVLAFFKLQERIKASSAPFDVAVYDDLGVSSRVIYTKTPFDKMELCVQSGIKDIVIPVAYKNHLQEGATLSPVFV